MWVVFGAAAGAYFNYASQAASGQPIDWWSVGLAGLSGAFGGALGTITRGLGVVNNIIANSVGSGLIGMGSAALKNRITGSCDDIINAGFKSLMYGGIGAGAGNIAAGTGRHSASLLSNKRWDNFTLDEKLFYGSNAITGPGKVNIFVTIGAVLGDTAGTIIANLP